MYHDAATNTPFETVVGRNGRITFFRNDLIIGRSLRSYGEWAENEIGFLRRLISAGDTVLDVGANIGTHTLALAAQVGTRGTVIAIEPRPEIFELLRQNVEQNDISQVRLEQAAAGAELNEIIIPALDITASINFGSVSLPTETVAAMASDFRHVRILTIDALALSSCSLIKIDVEGMEDLALAGAKRTICDLKPFIYAECNTLENGVAIKSRLDELGYKCFLHLTDAYNPKNFLGNTDNWFADAREAAILGVHPDRIDTILRLIEQPDEILLRVEDADAIAFGLLQKPQFFSEALSVSSAGSAYYSKTKLLGEPAASRAFAEKALGELTDLRIQLATAISERDKATLQFSLLEDQHMELKVNFSDLRALHNDALRDSMELRKDLNIVVAQRDTALNELNSLETQRADLKGRIADLIALNDQAAKDAEHLRAEIVEATADRDDLSSELNDSTARVSHLEHLNTEHLGIMRRFEEFVVRWAASISTPTTQLRYGVSEKFAAVVKSVLPKHKESGLEAELSAIRRSIFFDPEYYWQTYADVKAHDVDPAVHYLKFGSAEGRNPGPFFSSKRYLNAYRDVAVSGLTALGHYELYGRREKRFLPLFEALENEYPIRQAEDLDCQPTARAGLDAYLTIHPELEAGTPSPLGISVSVVIPTYNAGSEFPSLVRKLQQQKGLRAVEIIVVDSESSDETTTIARELGCRVVPIKQSEFSHSRSRNLGAEAATGDLLVFMVQDAYPIGEYWLYGLARCLNDNIGVAAVSCAEYPRSDSEIFYDSLLKTHYDFIGCSEGDRVGRYTSDDNMSLRSQGQLSDVACAIPRDLFLSYKYSGSYAEDLTLGIKLIRDGYLVGMLSSIRVIHSHSRPAQYFVRRAFVDVAFLDEIFPDFRAPRNNDVAGSLICASALWRGLKTIQASRNVTAVDAINEIIADVRKLKPQPYAETLDPCDGFSFPPLKHWIEKFDRSRQLKKSGRHAAIASSIRQTLNMFVDRLTHLRSMLGVYPMVDDSVARELNDAVRKSLAMVVGSQLAFCCINPSAKQHVENLSTLLEELKRLLSAGI